MTDLAAIRVQPWLGDGDLTFFRGDAFGVLRGLPAGVAQTCVTSPPYWGLRDYGIDGQLGLEASPDQYVARMVEVFREVRRVLRDDGTLWLNIGDSYAPDHAQKRTRTENYGIQQGIPGSRHRDSRGAPPGLKGKDLVGIPWRVAFALQADGWVLRSEIIWSKPNPMPESVTDRPTKAHEQVFLFSKARWVGAERPMAMRPEDAAWLAALIDGEGTICFQERENAHANHVGIRLSIVNTCTPLLDRVRESAECAERRGDASSSGPA